MADYIDRQEVIETLAFYREDPDGIDHALNSIKNIPSADVQPVMHGKWVQIKLLQDGYKAKECSACKATFWDLYRWNYCPNCGTKMDGET